MIFFCQGVGDIHTLPDDLASHNLCPTCHQAWVELEAWQPPLEERTWEMFAHANDDGTFTHFHESTGAVNMCGSGQVVLTRLRLDPEGTRWGWYHSFHPYNRGARGRVSMIGLHEMAVRICFPYGPEVETAAGKGQIVRLSAQLVRPALGREGIRGYEP